MDLVGNVCRYFAPGIAVVAVDEVVAVSVVVAAVAVAVAVAAVVAAPLALVGHFDLRSMTRQ